MQKQMDKDGYLTDSSCRCNDRSLAAESRRSTGSSSQSASDPPCCERLINPTLWRLSVLLDRDDVLTENVSINSERKYLCCTRVVVLRNLTNGLKLLRDQSANYQVGSFLTGYQFDIHLYPQELQFRQRVSSREEQMWSVIIVTDECLRLWDSQRRLRSAVLIWHAVRHFINSLFHSPWCHWLPRCIFCPWRAS